MRKELESRLLNLEDPHNSLVSNTECEHVIWLKKKKKVNHGNCNNACGVTLLLYVLHVIGSPGYYNQGLTFVILINTNNIVPRKYC